MLQVTGFYIKLAIILIKELGKKMTKWSIKYTNNSLESAK